MPVTKVYSGETVCTHTGRGRAQGPLAIVFRYSCVRWVQKELKTQCITTILPAIGNTERRWAVSLDVRGSKHEYPQLIEHSSAPCPIAKQLEEQKQLTVFPICSVCKVKADTEHQNRLA